jgi:DnaJ-class molecular chaperone
MLAEQAFVVIYAHVSKLELETPAGASAGFRGVIAENTECPQCQASGRVPMYHGLRDKECPRCRGRGWIKSKS